MKSKLSACTYINMNENYLVREYQSGEHALVSSFGGKQASQVCPCIAH